MSSILSDAEEEIARTAEEVAREVAAVNIGEITYQISLAESWKKEAARLERSRLRWRKATILEAAVLLGGTLVLALTR